METTWLYKLFAKILLILTTIFILSLFNFRHEKTKHKISIVSEVKKSRRIRTKNMLFYNPCH